MWELTFPHLQSPPWWLCVLVIYWLPSSSCLRFSLLLPTNTVWDDVLRYTNSFQLLYKQLYSRLHHKLWANHQPYCLNMTPQLEFPWLIHPMYKKVKIIWFNSLAYYHMDVLEKHTDLDEEGWRNEITQVKQLVTCLLLSAYQRLM